MFDFQFSLLTLSIFVRFHELAKDIKYNKGGILAATVSYLKMLKMDQIRKNHLEEEVRAQALQNRKLLNKIQVGGRDRSLNWLQNILSVPKHAACQE